MRERRFEYLLYMSFLTVLLLLFSGVMGKWHLSSYNKLNLETLKIIEKNRWNVKYKVWWSILTNYESPTGIYFHISKYTNNCVYVQSLSFVWLSVTPWTVACQAPLSMGLSRQKYWSGLPNFFLQRILLIRDQTRVFCIGMRILYHWATWEAQQFYPPESFINIAGIVITYHYH